jgi:hypothetical protein
MIFHIPDRLSAADFYGRRDITEIEANEFVFKGLNPPASEDDSSCHVIYMEKSDPTDIFSINVDCYKFIAK